MSQPNHLYIISYDLDNSSDSAKSKRLIEFLRKYYAVSLTKSTWLVCTPSDCRTVFHHVSNVIENTHPLFSFIPSGEKDRVFVAEITGEVLYDNLICDEPGNGISLSKLLEISKSETVIDGYAEIAGK